MLDSVKMIHIQILDLKGVRQIQPDLVLFSLISKLLPGIYAIKYIGCPIIFLAHA